MVSPFREGFVLTKLGICEVSRKNKNLAKISEFTVFDKNENVSSDTNNQIDIWAVMRENLSLGFLTSKTSLLGYRD